LPAFARAIFSVFQPNSAISSAVVALSAACRRLAQHVRGAREVGFLASFAEPVAKLLLDEGRPALGDEIGEVAA
jgi:hypothetical protein